MRIDIYDANYRRIAVDPVFIDFRWVRRFSRPGEFQITTPFTQEMFDYFKPYQPPRPGQPAQAGHVVHKQDTDEVAFVENRHVVQTIDNKVLLVARGRFASCLLDRRVVSLEGRLGLAAALQNIVQNNFLAPAGAGRNMPNVRLLPTNVPNASVYVNASRRGADVVIRELLEEHQAGVRVRWNFDSRVYEIEFYQPRETLAEFSKDFTNVSEQEYWEDTEQYKNVVFVGDEFTHGVGLGFERREMAIGAPAEGTETIQEAGSTALGRNAAVRTITNVINTANPQFVYLRDWDLGSIVTTENRELGFESREVVVEVTEFFDESGRNIEVRTEWVRQ